MVSKRICCLLTACIAGLGSCAPAEPNSPAMTFNRSVELPVVHLTDLSGNTHTLQDFKGKPFILTFWAPWCAMCLGEMPSLIKLRNSFGSEPLAVVAVAIESEKDEVESAVSQYRLPFSVLLDSAEEAQEQFKITELPVSMVVDAAGKIVKFPDPITGLPVERIVGPREWSSYQTARAFEALRAE